MDSVRHSLAAGDADSAATALAGCWLALVTNGESAVLNELLDLFPEDAVVRHPDVAIASAFSAVRRDDVEVSLALVTRALGGAARLSPPRRHAVEVMATVVRLYAATLTGNGGDGNLADTALELLDAPPDDTVALLRESRTRRALLLYNLGAFETSRQQYDAAGRHLDAALTEARLLDLPYLELSCAAQLLERQLINGHLCATAEQGRRILDNARARGWNSYHGLTTAHVGLAAVALLRDDLPAVLDHLDEARRVARPVDHLNRARIHLLRAMALCGTGRLQEAGLEVDRVSQQATGGDCPAWVGGLADVIGSWLQACGGNPERALRRLRGVGDLARGFLPYDALVADLLLRTGRADECEELLSPWLKQEGRGPFELFAHVVGALVANELGRRDQALEMLDSVLGVVAREGLVTPVLLPGPRVGPLLEALLDRGTAHEEAALGALDHLVRRDRGPARLANAPYYVEPLSGRELEVLRRLQGTGTNQDVAAALFISGNTLRTHMKSINRKLGASNRRDAVRRARRMGIL